MPDHRSLYNCAGCNVSVRSYALPHGWIRVTAWSADYRFTHENFHSNDCMFDYMHVYGFGSIV